MRRVPAIFPSQDERRKYGCIATLERDHERLSKQFRGTDAVRQVVAYCRENGWRIVCLSTPGTIYRDLQGTREDLYERERFRSTGIATRPEGARLPERSMLTKAEADELLVPRTRT